MRTQFGRSMIEMLGVLAIIGVLSIGGIALYRRAVNNHHANTILDDVNRFAFVIVEKGNYPLDAVIPKGDFKESGIYTLKGYQAESGQYSITVKDVPKGVCEPLVDKGHIEYKVGVVTAGGSVDNEILYDTLNTDICTHDLNDVAFYFGDTSLVCNDPDESNYTPCTANSDCCGEYFCAFENATDCGDKLKGAGTCLKLKDYPYDAVQTSEGHIWIRSKKTMTWWSAQNWCVAQGKAPASRADLGCEYISNNATEFCTVSAPDINNGGEEAGLAYEGSVLRDLQDNGWSSVSGWHWLNIRNSCSTYSIVIKESQINKNAWRHFSFYALCH